jgi:hypothetical protein
VGYCYVEAPVATSPRQGICDNVKSHSLALSSLSVTDFRPVLDPCVVVVTPVTTDSHRRLGQLLSLSGKFRDRNLNTAGGLV